MHSICAVFNMCLIYNFHVSVSLTIERYTVVGKVP